MASLTTFFRVIYRTFYSFLHLLLLALLLVTPGDIINQSRLRHSVIPILIVAICYVFAILFVTFVYFMRLYINRTVLNSIPKSWIPIDKGDVTKNVRRMIVMGLSRSAAIAFVSRPRVAPPALPGSIGTQAVSAEEKQQEREGREGDRELAAPHGESSRRRSFQVIRLKKTATLEEEMGISLPPHRPVWGEIEHPGWASPESPDLPNLQYATVVAELPNLIEAKALTLAPPDPESRTDPPMLDPEAVALLQRPASMGLRDYLTHLEDLGVLGDPDALHAAAEFVAMYEEARFGARPISNARFRELMHHFAAILRAMEPLDPAVLYEDDDGDGEDSLAAPPSESDIDNDAPMASTNPSTPRSRSSRSSRRRARGGRRSDSPASVASRPAASTSSASPPGGGGGRGDDAGRELTRPKDAPRSSGLAVVGRNSSANTWQQYRTAPTTPKSRRTGVSRPSSSSASSAGGGSTFARTRRPFPMSSQPSTASLRSAASWGSGGSGGSAISGVSGVSGGSVIRLSDRRDPTDLPYVLTLVDTG